MACHFIRKALFAAFALWLPLTWGDGVATSPMFKAGDRWAVIGDSITHGRRYHSFVYLFYATRFPGNRFSTYNCGISGDSAGGAVGRFPWDIAVHKPTVATIMLGMNDVGRGLYGETKRSPEFETRRKQALDGHVANMDRLAGMLRDIGSRVVFLTPSIYDQTGDLRAENCFGVNDALGVCGQRVGELTGKYDATVIDLHGPMTELNASLQKTDLKKTLVGPDRVHPGDPGQFVMAYLILKGQGVPGTVAEMVIDAAGGRTTTAENCTITNLQASSDGVQFDVLEEALPYPVRDSASEALDIVPFMAEMNREDLIITGLTEGSYVLKIDGIVCDSGSADTFAAGLHLAGNTRTPMYAQALQVQAANDRRHNIVGSRLRTFASQRHWLCRRHKDLDPENYEAMKAVLLEGLEKRKDHPSYGYFKSQADIYIKYKPQEQELIADVAKATDEMWTVNQPRLHHFEIVPATGDDMAELSGRLIDNFAVYSGWQFTSWTDAEPVIETKDGVLWVKAPRKDDHRDMLGLSKSISIDLREVKALKISMKASAGAHFGAEVVVDGKLKRIASYQKTTGEWTILSLPVSGVKATSLTLILAEPGANVVGPAETVDYFFDKIWFE